MIVHVELGVIGRQTQLLHLIAGRLGIAIHQFILHILLVYLQLSHNALKPFGLFIRLPRMLKSILRRRR
jgi:hypothetical protein